MPFNEIYSVNFAGGNFDPDLNVPGWPAMTLSTPDAQLQPQMSSDTRGITLSMTREATASAPAQFSVYVVPPAGSLPLDSRLFLRVTFDRPRGTGIPLVAETLGFIKDAEPGARSGETERVTAAETIEWPGIPTRVGPGLVSSPEPWAVGVNVSPDVALPSPTMVNVTCQFNRQTNGVRLNTPSGLQTDQAANLETPLNYDAYQDGHITLPGGIEIPIPPPIFALEHSFCGWNLATNGHTPGAGSLRLSGPLHPAVMDHRVYSSRTLAITPPVTQVGALGATLAELGIGRVSVRLLSFAVWRN